MNKPSYDFDSIIDDTPELFEIFHRDSSIHQNHIKKRVIKRTSPFKIYPRFKSIALPKPLKINKGLISSIKNRTSKKEYSIKKIKLKEISTLLYYGLGLKDLSRPYSSSRVSPSIDKVYPIEAYILSLNSVLSTGVYHYNIKTHALEILSKTNKKKISSLFSQTFVQDSGIIICLSSKFLKTKIEYKNRGYRLALLEAGHIAQNILLVSTALTLGSCPVDSFYDSSINSFLHLFPRHEAIIYGIVIGKLI